jgi:uroporphyrinogen-III synthase
MRVLVTRPAEDQDRTAAALRAAGHEAVAAPLFVVEALPHDAPGDADRVVATSANALRHARLDERHRALPLFAVGGATAAETARAGFRDIRTAEGDARALAALVSREAGTRLLYLAGRPRRDAALQVLGERFVVTTLETYETVAAERLPEAAAKALRSDAVEAVLHFSPRATAVFEALADDAGLGAEARRLLHVFISAAAERHSFPRRRIAARPNLAAMISALGAAARDA